MTPGLAKASNVALWASLSAATQQVELRQDKTTRQAKSSDPA